VLNALTRVAIVAAGGLLASGEACNRPAEAPSATAPATVKATAPAATDASKLTPEALAERTVHRRAVEAVIWGMPAVNYDLMLQEMLTKTQAKENEIVYWGKPADWKNQTLTPNPDVIYLMIFFNTKDGPIVIDVPPADGGSFAANIDNLWQMPLEDAGPNGADKGKGGKYLILPPGYNEKVPAGYIALPSDTFAGFALFRSNLPSHSDADVAKAVAYGKRLKVYLLSRAANPGETTFTDAKDVVYDSTIQYDVRFFRSLDRIVQNEPWLTRDKAMIDPLRSIGIEKGKPFNPDAKATDVLNAAAIEARDLLEQKYDTGFAPFFPDRRWFTPAIHEFTEAVQSGYIDPNQYPVDARGVIYTMGFIGIKRLGTAQFYLITIRDKDGRPFEGGQTYRLSVPANPPMKQYWSATVYDRQTHALVRNMPRASRASNSTEVQKNADGSVDIYFGPKAPAGKDSNWVPTDPQRRFEVMFRLYGPEKALFDKTWQLPDIEKVR
jgi:hypothetical protein